MGYFSTLTAVFTPPWAVPCPDTKCVSEGERYTAKGLMKDAALLMLSSNICRFTGKFLSQYSSSPKDCVEQIFDGPVLEELIFRGLLLTGCSRFQKGVIRWRKLTSEEEKSNRVNRVLLTSVLFGLWHLDQGFIGSGMAACFGITAGYLKERYDSVAVPMILHGMINAALVAIGLKVSSTALLNLFGIGYFTSNIYLMTRSFRALKA